MSQSRGSRGEEVEGESGLVESGRSQGGRTGRGSTASRFPRLPVPVQRKSATPSRMMTVEPDKMMFICPTWNPSMLTAFWLLPEESGALGRGPALHKITLAGERLECSWSAGEEVQPQWQQLLLCHSC